MTDKPDAPQFVIEIERRYEGYWAWSIRQANGPWWKSGETATRWGARRAARYEANRRAKQLRTPIHRETYTPGAHQ